MPVTHVCEQCDSPFAMPPCRKPRYCSPECHYDASAEAAWESYAQKIRDLVYAGDPLKCIEWPGRRDRDGYGIVGHSRRHGLIRASRLAFEVFSGSAPGSASVLHSCDNPPCCNPHHLFLGDNIANMADRQSKGRTLRGERHGGARLTEEQVRYIRGSRASSIKLAGEIAISSRQIRLIRAGKVWRHVQ